MKRILTFILLKIVEIGGVVFIPWGVGKFVHHAALNYSNWFGNWIRTLELFNDPVWIDGMSFLVIHLLLPVAIVAIIFLFICGNWEWAKHLTTKKGGK